MDCDRALSLEPGNESALVLKVNFGIRNGNTEQAMAASQKAVSLYPSSALAYSTRGLVYGVKGNLPLAIADIKTSLTLDPDNASTLNNMGWMLLRQGRPSVAISYLDRAVGKNKNANILGSRSWANFFMGNYNAALADCIAAERADPSYTGYRTIRFRVKYIQEGPASASAYLQQEIAYGKSSDQYHKVLEYYCGRRSLDSLKRDPLWLNYDVMTREFGTDQIASLSSADINEPDIPNEGNVSCDLRIVNVASGTVESAASGRAGIHQLESLAKALVKKLKRGILVEKETVAIITLRNRTGTDSCRAVADEFADKIAGALVDTNWFDVRERIDLKTLLTEKDLDTAEIVNNPHVRDKLDGVTYIIIGGVSLHSQAE